MHLPNAADLPVWLFWPIFANIGDIFCVERSYEVHRSVNSQQRFVHHSHFESNQHECNQNQANVFLI